jgi:hypothetical protein
MTTREKDLAGCCGLFCGLCPRYQSKAPSRCLGCQLGEQHSYCSIYRCCNRNDNFTCADCNEYPCERLLRVLGVEKGLDSFISHRPALNNLDRIQKDGLEAFLEEQKERRLLVEELMARFNEGRSMTFFCTAGALLPPDALRETVAEVEGLLGGSETPKERAKLMRNAIGERAKQDGVDLKLRRGGGS